MAGKKRTSSSDAVAAAAGKRMTVLKLYGSGSGCFQDLFSFDPHAHAELPAKKNNTTTDYASLSFDSDASNKSGCKWNLKISSW